MKLTFHGAAGMVTGSCYLLEAAGEKILIDCGMFQGSKEITRLNYEPFGFDPKAVSYVLLTHAHIDHSGLIPKLAKWGFRGTILATPPTTDLAKIMLEDSALVSQDDTAHENKRRLRAGLPPRKPLYEPEDVKTACQLFRRLDYDKPCALTDNLAVTFRNAGHILGSSIIELSVKEGGKTTRLAFSGDLGQGDTPLLDSPATVEDADFVLVESTYGNRSHGETGLREQLLSKEVQDAFKKGGMLMIPSFAMERTQELLYYLHRLDSGKAFPNELVFLDSPLAIKATKIFNSHLGYFSPALKKEFKAPFSFGKLKFLETSGESRSMNDYAKPCIIIAGSGMCTSGRIRYHLKYHLWNPQNTLLFVGYQAEGTLGRVILEGAKMVKMMGLEVAVKARVNRIESFSSHADSDGLVKWVAGFRKKPKKVFIVHGEEAASRALEANLRRAGFATHVPRLGESVELG
jgi:metallo-beta-lactamase family protein